MVSALKYIAYTKQGAEIQLLAYIRNIKIYYFFKIDLPA